MPKKRRQNKNKSFFGSLHAVPQLLFKLPFNMLIMISKGNKGIKSGDSMKDNETALWQWLCLDANVYSSMFSVDIFN